MRGPVMRGSVAKDMGWLLVPGEEDEEDVGYKPDAEDESATHQGLQKQLWGSSLDTSSATRPRKCPVMRGSAAEATHDHICGYEPDTADESATHQEWQRQLREYRNVLYGPDCDTATSINTPFAAGWEFGMKKWKTTSRSTTSV
jgi:hypothetical protein